MIKQFGLAFVVLLAIVFGALPSAKAAGICKDGFVTHTISAAAASRSIAEASAIRAWRRAGTAPFNYGKARAKVRCVQEQNSRKWRCFVKAGRCATV
jgi:hypothetical protein